MPTNYSQPLAPYLIEAYHNTDYSFETPQQLYVIRLNDANTTFADFLKANGINSWAFITAWNPYSISMPAQYNHDKQQELYAKLKEYDPLPGKGQGQDTEWPAEESYFVANIKEDIAIALGQEFGQNAILTGNADGKATLKILFESYSYSFENGQLKIKATAAKL